MKQPPVSEDLATLDQLEVALRNLAPHLDSGLKVAERWARRPAYAEVAGPLEHWLRRCPLDLALGFAIQLRHALEQEPLP